MSARVSGDGERLTLPAGFGWALYERGSGDGEAIRFVRVGLVPTRGDALVWLAGVTPSTFVGTRDA